MGAFDKEGFIKAVVFHKSRRYVMKKMETKPLKIAGIALAGALLLAGVSGCGNAKQTAVNQTQQSKQTQTSDQKSKTSNLEAQKSKPENSQVNNQTQSHLATLNQEISASLSPLNPPSQIEGVASSEFINASLTKTPQEVTVHYYSSPAPLPLNASPLASQTPILTLKKQSYNSPSAALQNLNYWGPSFSNGLPVVQLGNGIKGKIGAGAGQRYLHWNVGPWSFLIHKSSIGVRGQNVDGSALAIKEGKRVVSAFSQTQLESKVSRGSFFGEGKQIILQWISKNPNNSSYIFTLSSPETRLNSLIALANTII